ncbi:unnamed protein product, partial [Symbiodinium sp. KB8]
TRVRPWRSSEKSLISGTCRTWLRLGMRRGTVATAMDLQGTLHQFRRAMVHPHGWPVPRRPGMAWLRTLRSCRRLLQAWRPWAAWVRPRDSPGCQRATPRLMAAIFLWWIWPFSMRMPTWIRSHPSRAPVC